MVIKHQFSSTTSMYYVVVALGKLCPNKVSQYYVHVDLMRCVLVG